MVAEHHDAVIALDELAPAQGLPEHLEHVCVRLAVVGAEDGLDGFGGLAGVVEGDSAAVVVEDVGLDEVVEEEPANKAEVPVNGGAGAARKGPLGVGVAGQRHVGVLQVGDEDHPVVDKQVGEEPVDEAGEGAEAADPEAQDGELEQDACVGGHDVPEVTLVEDQGVWVEVGGTEVAAPPAGAGGELRVGLARGVEEQVGLEAHGLLDEQRGDGHERRVLGELCKRHDPPLVLPLVQGGRHVRHVLAQVAVVLVVLSVGELPAEVGVEAVGVQHPPDRVVDPPVVRERLVPALVRQDPQPRHGQRQQAHVDGPAHPPQRRRPHQRDRSVRHARQHHHAQHVSQHIPPGFRQTRPEALFRNRLEHVVDGKVGSTEPPTRGVHGLRAACGPACCDASQRAAATRHPGAACSADAAGLADRADRCRSGCAHGGCLTSGCLTSGCPTMSDRATNPTGQGPALL